jgi:hypothetical protein
MNIIPPPNWQPNDEQAAEFLKIKKQLLMISSVEELQKALEKLSLPEIRIVLNALDHMGRDSRQNFRVFKRLCEERFGIRTVRNLRSTRSQTS